MLRRLPTRLSFHALRLAASPDGRKRKERERKRKDKTRGGRTEWRNQTTCTREEETGKGRETGVKNSSGEGDWSKIEGAWLGVEVGGATEHDEGVKVSLQHKQPRPEDQQH